MVCSWQASSGESDEAPKCNFSDVTVSFSKSLTPTFARETGSDGECTAFPHHPHYNGRTRTLAVTPACVDRKAFVQRAYRLS